MGWVTPADVAEYLEATAGERDAIEKRHADRAPLGLIPGAAGPHTASSRMRDAAFAHCYFCHKLLGSDAPQFAAWAEGQLGEGLYQIVREKFRELYRGWKRDLGDISNFYQAEYERMEALRSDGVCGRIEFQSWN